MCYLFHFATLLIQTLLPETPEKKGGYLDQNEATYNKVKRMSQTSVAVLLCKYK